MWSRKSRQRGSAVPSPSPGSLRDPTSPRKERREVKKGASLVFVIGTRRIRQFAIERFAIAQASAQEFRPRRDGNVRRDPLGQQAPEVRMMPAQIVTGAITVRADAGSQSLHFREQLLAVQPFK